MTLGQLSHPNLDVALVKLSKADLPIKLAYKIKKFLQKYNEEFKKYNELKNELIMKHSRKDTEGNPVLVDGKQATFEEENFKLFLKDLTELQDIQVNLPAFEEEEFGESLNKITLTVEDMFALEPVINFKE